MAFHVLFFTKQPILALGMQFGLSGMAEVVAVNTIPLLILSAADPAHKRDVIFLDMASEITLNDIALIASDDERVVLFVDSCHTAFACQAMQVGVKGVFRKVLSIEQLKMCVREVCEGKGWFEPELLQSIVRAHSTRLSRRERDFAVLVAQGRKNKEIAADLLLTEGTVKVYLSRLFEKLGVADRYELAIWAQKNIAPNAEASTRITLPVNDKVLKQFVKTPSGGALESAPRPAGLR